MRKYALNANIHSLRDKLENAINAMMGTNITNLIVFIDQAV
jgi:hypothetical protein